MERNETALPPTWWQDMAKRIRARAVGMRQAASSCTTYDGSQFDRFALLARADEAERIAAQVEDAIKKGKEDL